MVRFLADMRFMAYIYRSTQGYGARLKLPSRPVEDTRIASQPNSGWVNPPDIMYLMHAWATRGTVTYCVYHACRQSVLVNDSHTPHVLIITMATLYIAPPSAFNTTTHMHGSEATPNTTIRRPNTL